MVFRNPSCTSTAFVIVVVVGVKEERTNWFQRGREGEYTTITTGVGWRHVATAGCVDGFRGECDYRWIWGLLVYPG